LPFALYFREVVVHGRMKLRREDSWGRITG
jgi:hypothetical protein